MICAEVYCSTSGALREILDKHTLILYAPDEVNTSHWRLNMTNLSRWDPFRGISSFQEQINRMFEDTLRGRTDQSALTTWAPAVDIYETEQELVVKADLPDVNEKDLEIRVENNVLTIRGERKFEKKVSEEHRPPLCGGCMSLKLFSRARQLWCGPSKIRGTTWLG